MKQVTKEVYYCDHCSKHGLSKWQMERHEKYCPKDPKNIPKCWGCANLVVHENESYEHYYEGGGEIHTRDIPIPTYYTCKQLNKSLHTLGAVRKKLLEKYPESFEYSELMPNSCELFKSEVI